MATLPRNVDGQRCILAGFARQGAAAGSWVRASGTRSVLLLRDAASLRGCSIADGFVRSMAFVRMEALDSFEDPGKRAALIRRILANPPGIVFYSGEDAPYGTSEALFSELRANGYAGTLVMGEADPEVSFLALPCRVPEGTYLVSPIGPPSPAFASAYEPATGRHAGPHGWVGYLAMKATLEVLEQATTGKAEELQAIARRLPPLRPSCALYVVRNGAFEFVQELK
jgi:ABC-type branched-subunit amino acid transport system substrate-binding protein